MKDEFVNYNNLLIEKAKQKAAEEETTVSAIIRKLLLDYTRAS